MKNLEDKQYLNPYISNSVLNEISYRLNDLRDVKILQTIQSYRQQGYSIFVGYGLGHLIAQKKALEKITLTPSTSQKGEKNKKV